MDCLMSLGYFWLAQAFWSFWNFLVGMDCFMFLGYFWLAQMSFKYVCLQRLFDAYRIFWLAQTPPFYPLPGIGTQNFTHVNSRNDKCKNMYLYSHCKAAKREKLVLVRCISLRRNFNWRPSLSSCIAYMICIMQITKTKHFFILNLFYQKAVLLLIKNISSMTAHGQAKSVFQFDHGEVVFPAINILQLHNKL